MRFQLGLSAKPSGKKQSESRHEIEQRRWLPRFRIASHGWCVILFDEVKRENVALRQII
jgi:hypothetical protein